MFFTLSCGKNSNVGSGPVSGSSDQVTISIDDNLSGGSEINVNSGETSNDPSLTGFNSGSIQTNDLPVRSATLTTDEVDEEVNSIDQQSVERRLSFSLSMPNSEVAEGTLFNVLFTNTGNGRIDLGLLNTPSLNDVYSFESTNCLSSIGPQESCSFTYRAHLIQDTTVSSKITSLAISYSDPLQTVRASLNLTIKNLDYNSDSGHSGYTQSELNSYLSDNIHTVRDCITTEHFGAKGVVAFDQEDSRYYCQFRSFDHNVGYHPRIETKLTTNHYWHSETPTDYRNNYFCPQGWNILYLQYNKARVKQHHFFGVRWIDITTPYGEDICTNYSQIRFRCVKVESLFPRLSSVGCF